MRSFAISRPFSLLSLAAFATLGACSATTSGPGTPVEEAPAGTTPTPSGTGTTAPAPAPSAPDAGGGPITKPPVDKTARFELTLDGETIPVTTVTVKVTPAAGSGSNATPERVAIAGSYEQQLNGGYLGMTSTATFTIYADSAATGLDVCGNGGRSAGYWFKDTDGTLRGMGTDYQGGSCTMDVTANAADGFTSGSAKGTIGGVTTKSFTVRWGQPLPKK
jgi:hypothetical protein